MMTPGFIPDAEFRERFEASLVRIDYDRVSSCGILHLLGAWWRSGWIAVPLCEVAEDLQAGLA